MPSRFDCLPEPVPDVVFKMDAAAKAAPEPKINLVIGAYRNEFGQPQVLHCVREAEVRLAADETINKEYLPINGLKAFRDEAAKLIFGPACDQALLNRLATAQTISGTGACRVAAEFLSIACPRRMQTPVYVSDPTWANHIPIFQYAGFKNIQKYRYYNPKDGGVDIEGMVGDIEAAEDGSVFVLHLCAHNPTGADPTESEWERIADVVIRKQHLVIFDSAYQGYASGCLDKDAFAARLFLSKGIEFCVAQSFAKNMGLYAERVGCFTAVCNNHDSAERVSGTLKNVIRPMYSNPPAHGARVAELIMRDPQLRAEWTVELKGMSDRIIKMRHILRDTLVELGTPGCWDHITKQIGMFSYTRLNAEQCKKLVERNVFLLMSGRISVAGLTESTARDLAKHIDEIVRETA